MGYNIKPKRPIWIEGDIAYVRLTKGYTAILDAVDFSLVEGRNWQAQVCRANVVYAVRGIGTGGVYAGVQQMHRAILGVPQGILVDHRDGNGLNNRRSNLRAASHRDNNTRNVCENKFGFKGIYRRKKYKLRPWRASISVNNRLIELGRYATPEEAAAAYDEAALKHFGEFAKTNRSLGLI